VETLEEKLHKNKLLALLDLIDNSLDAAVVLNNNNEGEGERDKGDFTGRVHIYPDEVDNSNDSIQSVMNNVTSSNSTNASNSGLVIVNNSYKPIQSMKNCLGAYNSSKVDSGSSDIGENVSFCCCFVFIYVCVCLYSSFLFRNILLNSSTVCAFRVLD